MELLSEQWDLCVCVHLFLYHAGDEDMTALSSWGPKILWGPENGSPQN